MSEANIVQRIENHTIAPISPGQLVTGVSMQVTGIQNVAVVAKVELRRTLDAGLRKQRTALVAAQRALDAASADYHKQVATLLSDTTARDYARNIIAYLNYFHPQAAIVLAKKTDANGNTVSPTADNPEIGVEVNRGAKTYTVKMTILTSPHGQAISLPRSSALPSRVTDAMTVEDDARAKVAAIDTRIRELLTEKAAIPERAEAIEASLIRRQLGNLDGGKEFLDDMDAMKQAMMRECGLTDNDMA